MQPLEELVARVRAEGEVARQMQICNACRYCEGFCAVFPAMTRRLEFNDADAHYLANLCHNCGACLHACQYAAPHEFAVNVPQAMAKVRLRTYEAYAWPRAFGVLYHAAGLAAAMLLSVSLALFLVLGMSMSGPLLETRRAGDFYAIFPHDFLAMLFGAAFVYAFVALWIGCARWWRDVSPAGATPAHRRGATREAIASAASLRYLGGGHEEGCNEKDDRFTLARRWFHHFTFYGFLMCFAATCVATLYHYGLNLHAPYALASAPVVLGTLGGIGLVIGPLGLLWLNLRRDPRQGDPSQRGMDRAFIALLLLTSVTGLALLAWRDTRWMGLLLALHLGPVLALFITAPYGKFAHGIYRCAALLKYAIERRMPSAIQLKE